MKVTLTSSSTTIITPIALISAMGVMIVVLLLVSVTFTIVLANQRQAYEDADVKLTCTTCHSMGRVVSQRRTAEEWRLVTAMHRGYYPCLLYTSPSPRDS